MEFKKLTDREHIIQRPAMYIGATDFTDSKDFVLSTESNNTRISKQNIRYIPGLIKIINEIIDNSVDVAIKTDFKYSDTISVKITNTFIEVRDNGTGIPVKEHNGYQLAELAWGHARAGTNFTDDTNRTQIGMNGVGSFATNCFSKKFKGSTDDGTHNYCIEFKDNASSFTDNSKSGNIPKSTGKTGTTVKFWPDFDLFGDPGFVEIDDVHMNIIKERLINLSMSFPEITFKFNGKKVNVTSFKKYVQMFVEPEIEPVIFESDNYKFAFIPNEEDDFCQFSYVNGLKIPDGGTHVDIIMNNVIGGLRDKLKKRYKSIKPGDIKNKLVLIAFLKNVKNTKFNSQSKEKITNSAYEINDYFGVIPFDKIVGKLYRNSNIISPITEIYRIKEEFKKRQDLKKLTKKKKIKSEKYLPATSVQKYLLLVEGDSAAGGLIPVLGRKECGYYTLKGKPLNAFSAAQSKFTQNKELSELFSIIRSEDYEYIIFGTDQDLDGIHIRGLLIGFFKRYMPEMLGNIGILQTPVICMNDKKGNATRWVYSLEENIEPRKGETSNYMKGLGSWDTEDLKTIIQKDGLDKMIEILEFDDDKIITEWLSNDSEPRKKYILENDFSIAKA